MASFEGVVIGGKLRYVSAAFVDLRCLPRSVKLTDVLVKNTKATNKRQTLFDGGGLYLAIEPSGSRVWQIILIG